jgi:hypothetical protein
MDKREAISPHPPANASRALFLRPVNNQIRIRAKQATYRISFNHIIKTMCMEASSYLKPIEFLLILY